MQQVNQPITCHVCGGEWFYEVTLQQYASMYSASPGGDIHPISTTSHQIRICICGQPFQPNIGGVRSGRSGSVSVTGVMESLKKAVDSRAQVPSMVSKMGEDVVSREEFASVVQALTLQMETLGTPAAEAPAEKPAKTTTKKSAAKAEPAVPATEEK